MLPDDSCVRLDKYGCQFITVANEHLKDFPALIKWIKERGYGQDGILKLRLLDKDRNDVDNLREVLNNMKKAFEAEVITAKKGRVLKKRFSYNPDAQLFYKATLKEHIYEFVSAGCTEEERQHFVNKALQPESYVQSSNCCSEALMSGSIREHCFEKIDQLSVYSDIVKAKEKKWAELVGNRNRVKCASEEDLSPNPILYGAGIQCDPSSGIAISQGFNLGRLNTILNLLEDKHDGIVHPFIYCGTKHTAFPWHIEDGALFSIDYNLAGAPKVWFGIQPCFYGLVDSIASSFPIDPGHAACRALLVDHKVIVADPEYFRAHHGIPFSTVVQEQGDIVITFPFALHSGFNLGSNLTISSNFADMDWLELAMHAPICACNETQVQLNLTSILHVCRPDLLENYLCELKVIPSGHPRSIIATPRPVLQSRTPVPPSYAPAETNLKTSINSTSLMRARVLQCPQCPTSYTENKRSRLLAHIKKLHADQEERLLHIVEHKYLPWRPRVKYGYRCKVCQKVCRGSITQVRKHHSQFHGELPFERTNRLDW